MNTEELQQLFTLVNTVGFNNLTLGLSGMAQGLSDTLTDKDEKTELEKVSKHLLECAKKIQATKTSF